VGAAVSGGGGESGAGGWPAGAAEGSGDPPAHAIEVGIARATAEGEQVSGDDHVAVACRDGMLVAAIDGLGHGAAAGVAAGRAAEVLRAWPDEPLDALVQRCHAALAGTRGAALTLARIDARRRRLEWLGVGNVAGRLVHTGDPAEHALLLAGVVGDQLPPLRAVELPLGDGDTVLLATDGVDPDVGGELRVPGPLGPLADGLLRRHRRGVADDALVLLARYHGDPG
jgi:phosphoserine phosphatase RsbX